MRLPAAPAVTVSVAGRTVTVTGDNGKKVLKRAFKSVNFAAESLGKKTLRVTMWFGNRKEKACLRTVTTHIENMIAGVTEGFTYKMRFAYAHFPINVSLTKSGDDNFVEIRNFLGERRLRKVREGAGAVNRTATELRFRACTSLATAATPTVAGSSPLVARSPPLHARSQSQVKMHDGVTVKRSDNVKDELVLTGNDLEKVSGSAALIHESTLVRNKDIRKFLDGLYVSVSSLLTRALRVSLDVACRLRLGMSP